MMVAICIWLVAGWWLVVCGWWLVVCGWWLVVCGWWLVVGGWQWSHLVSLLCGLIELCDPTIQSALIKRSISVILASGTPPHPSPKECKSWLARPNEHSWGRELRRPMMAHGRIA